MQLKLIRGLTALGTIGLAIILIAGFDAGPSSPNKPAIEGLRSELSAIEATLPGLKARLAHDEADQPDLTAEAGEHRSRWAAIKATNRRRMDEARHHVAELRLRIQELETGIEPAKPEIGGKAEPPKAIRTVPWDRSAGPSS